MATIATAPPTAAAESRLPPPPPLQHVVIHADNTNPLAWRKIFSYASQVVNFIAVLVFGLWSVRSFNSAQLANQISSGALEAALTANQIALLSFCAANTVGSFGVFASFSSSPWVVLVS
jgi:hypothetical protein